MKIVKPPPCVGSLALRRVLEVKAPLAGLHWSIPWSVLVQGSGIMLGEITDYECTQIKEVRTLKQDMAEVKDRMEFVCAKLDTMDPIRNQVSSSRSLLCVMNTCGHSTRQSDRPR